jgi:hypothetical protein
MALVIPVLAAALCPSCDLYKCDKGETETDDACEQVQQAAERRAATCNVGKELVGALCTLNCVKSSQDGKYCRGNDEVAACLQGMESVACRDFSRTSIEGLSSCSSLLDRLANDCAESASSSHHSDDDWD